MQRILLISPSSNRFYVPTAPLGLAYIAGNLPLKTDVQGLDLNVLKWVHGLSDEGIIGSIANYLEKSKLHGVLPDIIGLTVYQETLGEATHIGELARRYNITTVAGGIYPTHFPEAFPFSFDYLIRGDGEEPFRLLAEALAIHSKPEEVIGTIPGISYKESLENGRMRWKNEGAYIAQTRPSPRRNIFSELHMGFHYFSARIISSMGCPYACSFCVNSEHAYRVWKGRPADEVIDEVYTIVRDPAISEIAFSDDQFLGCSIEDYNRAYQILQAIEALTRGGNLRISLQVRADHFLRALDALPQLKTVIQCINRNFVDPNPSISRQIHGRPVRGFSLDIGVESNLSHRLQRFAKGLTVETNRRAVKRAREMELDLGIYMILFTPELTMEELREEFEIYLLEDLETETPSTAAFFGLFNELIPYRGTKVYREMKGNGSLVEREGYTGFRFSDPRVAAFYIQYLHGLYANEFNNLSVPELIKKFETMFHRSELLGLTHGAFLAEVECEMKKMDELERIYQKLVEY